VTLRGVLTVTATHL